MKQIKFDDKNFRIYTQGHFNEWLCGFVTGLESIARGSKTIETISGIGEGGEGYESDLMQFTHEEEYKNFKEQFKWAIKYDSKKYVSMKDLVVGLDENTGEKNEN